MKTKFIISILSFNLLVLCASSQIVYEEEKKTDQKQESSQDPAQVKEEKKEEKATGTTTSAFAEYQSWSTDAMGGIFLPNEVSLLFYSFGGYPRYNFIAPSDYFTLSVGAPLNAGFSLLLSSFGNLIQFMGDVPITVDLNVGSRATPFNDNMFGAFFGGGINYNYMYYQINGATTNLHTFGPVIHGGFRWEFQGRETGFRISYLNGFGSPDESVNGIVVEGSPGMNVFSISILYGM